MMPTSLAQWLTWISQQHSNAIDLSLDRVMHVARKLNVLTFVCPIITVGGTNGKGSTIATLAAIYEAAGYRTGVYTSPHLLTYNERIVVAGQMVSDSDLCQALARVEVARGDVALTYFEFTTLAALLLFQQHALDVVLLEVGLGGRLDAVNIIDSDVVIVTGIDFDHMEWLGDTRLQIGYEKAGIFRANKPALYGDNPPLVSVVDSARDKGAILYLSQCDFSYQDNDVDWHWSNARARYDHLPKPTVLLNNAALALQAITLLQLRLPVPQNAIQRGLRMVTVLGRFQTIAQQPRCIVDVAHNPQASRQLQERMIALGWQGKLHIIFSMLATKDMMATLSPWRDVAVQWHIAPLAEINAASIEAITASFEALQITSYQKYGTIGEAYRKLRQQAAEIETILIFGSFHTVAAVMNEYSVK